MYKISSVSKMFTVILLITSFIGVSFQSVKYQEVPFLEIETFFRYTLVKGFRKLNLFDRIRGLFSFVLFKLILFLIYLLKGTNHDYENYHLVELPKDYPIELDKGFLLEIELNEVVRKYQKIFSIFNFDILPKTDPHRRGPKGHPLSSYVKAFLVGLEESKPSEKLREFLLDHPHLVVFIGFVPVIDKAKRYGFDIERTVPSGRHLRRMLRQIKNEHFKALLIDSVFKLMSLNIIQSKSISVSIDIKAIFAFVKENNLNTFVKDRFNKEKIPKGDKTCKLGVKRASNKLNSNKDEQKGEPFWGYKNGSVTIKTPFGEFTLFELTFTGEVNDIKFFFPLIKPLFHIFRFHIISLFADAAFDAWYVYATIKEQNGQAFIPLNTRGHDTSPHKFGPNGRHICDDNREMKDGGTWFDKKKGYRRRKDVCPILTKKAKQKGETCRCNHPKFQKGTGCIKTLNLDDPDQLRFQIDRSSKSFKKNYKFRTASERVFSNVDNYFMKHPKVRNIYSVQNRNTLIHILINAKNICNAVPSLA